MFKKFEFKKEYIHCVPDESLIGKYVLCADTYKKIIKQVESNNWTSCREVLVEINESDAIYPFGTKDTRSDIDVISYYSFVYYDPEWDEKDKEIVYYCVLIKGEYRSYFSYTSEKLDTHIYAKFTRIGDALDWCYSHDKLAEIAKEWEDGKTIQYFRGRNWINCADNKPCWELSVEYRVKPNEPVKVETSEGKMYLANGAEIPKKRRMTNKELARWLAQGNGQWMGSSCVKSMSYNYNNKDEHEVPDSIMIRSWDEEEWREPVIEETDE